MAQVCDVVYNSLVFLKKGLLGYVVDNTTISKNIVGTLIIFSFYNQVFKYYILQFNQSKF
jgi:hypothetical protein